MEYFRVHANIYIEQGGDSMYRVEWKNISSEIASYLAPPIKQLLLGLDEQYLAGWRKSVCVVNSRCC